MSLQSTLVILRCKRAEWACHLQATIVSSASAEELPTMGGVTARAVDDRANGLASNLLTAPPAAPLTDAALFIDVNSQSLGKEAQTKFFGWLFGGPWGGWCAPRLPPCVRM